MGGDYVLTIHSTPPLVLRTPALQELGDERGAINGEVPSMVVMLDNARGQLTGLFADPPLRVVATLRQAEQLVFVGRVQAVTLAAEIVLKLES